MRPPVIVVSGVLMQHNTKVPLVGNDQMILAFSAESAYHLFGDCVRLGRLNRAKDGFDAKPEMYDELERRHLGNPSGFPLMMS
jgi:hypothetical protein